MYKNISLTSNTKFGYINILERLMKSKSSDNDENWIKYESYFF